jgi:hypothetical protein
MTENTKEDREHKEKSTAYKQKSPIALLPKKRYTKLIANPAIAGRHN